MPEQESLGERIRSLRLRKNLSQAQLAWPELSDSYVSLIESGKRTPAPSMIALLARKLDCSESYLLTGVSEEAIAGLRETLRYAHIALENGAADEARIRFAEVSAHPAVTDIPGLEHEACWGHALALEATGALKEALGELERAARMISPTTEPDQWAKVHTALIRCHRELGDLTTSIQVGEKALDQLTAMGGQWTDAMVMLGSTILGAYIYRGDLAYARQFADMLTVRAEAIGTPKARMAAYWNAAWAAELSGDAPGALKLAERAIALLGEEDDARNLSRLRGAYGHFLLCARPDRAEEALKVLRQAQREMESTATSTVDLASCLLHQARAEIILGNPVEAASLARRAADLLSDTAGQDIAEAYTVLSEAQACLGQREEAVAALFQAVDYLEKMEAHRPAARAWFDLAELLGAAGQADGQKVAFQRALACMGL
ncbi:helix-turn-helix domain-containing protein [Actinoallomurus spadix]|uniref:helix-turn-helix domain-containing protein n=1 Tax=Actinoallomurus spadix TaxID=79912 RepID=UPI0025AFC53F|nr:helix-turn-helix domain-containing protein [Actinoallomurus spadix]